MDNCNPFQFYDWLWSKPGNGSPIGWKSWLILLAADWTKTLPHLSVMMQRACTWWHHWNYGAARCSWSRPNDPLDPTSLHSAPTVAVSHLERAPPSRSPQRMEIQYSHFLLLPAPTSTFLAELTSRLPPAAVNCLSEPRAIVIMHFVPNNSKAQAGSYGLLL